MLETRLIKSTKRFPNQGVTKSVGSHGKASVHLSINSFVVASEKLRSLKEPEAKLCDLCNVEKKKKRNKKTCTMNTVEALITDTLVSGKLY